MQTHNNSLLAFKTKVLIIITHTHKQKTGGLALVGWRWCACGTRQKDTLTPRCSLTAAVIATKVKWSKAVCVRACVARVHMHHKEL